MWPYFFDQMPSNALSGRPMSGRGRKGFGEAGTPFEQEKDPLAGWTRPWNWCAPTTRFVKPGCASASSEMVKAVEWPARPKVLGSRKGRCMAFGHQKTQ